MFVPIDKLCNFTKSCILCSYLTHFCVQAKKKVGPEVKKSFISRNETFLPPITQ